MLVKDLEKNKVELILFFIEIMVFIGFCCFIFQKIREDILVMKKYFISCKSAIESRLLWQLQEKQHFVENVDSFSLQDLIDINSGELLEYLEKVQAEFVKHIKEDCKVNYVSLKEIINSYNVNFFVVNIQRYEACPESSDAQKEFFFNKVRQHCVQSKGVGSRMHAHLSRLVENFCCSNVLK